MIFRGRSFSPKSELCELKRLFLLAGSRKRNATDPSSSAIAEVGLSGSPPFFFVRMSLESDRVQDMELCRLAVSPDRAENQKAIAILESEAAAAPKT